MTLGDTIWIWIGALLTFAMLSFLYKDNPLYRFGEHLFVGVSNGWSLAFMYSRVIKPVMIQPFGEACRIAGHEGLKPELFNPVAHANFLVIIPGLIGCLYFTRFITGMTWLVRIPIGIFMGYYAGLAVPATFEGSVFPQMKDTIITRGYFAGTPTGSLWAGICALIILVGVLGTLTYFYFSKEHKGPLQWGSRVGIVFVMIGFGASFGFTVMARVSLAIGRFAFLLHDWLRVIS
jgi:hypothetical protein